MLHHVDVANEGGDILSLPLGQPTSGIILTGMDGLDPGKATLVSSNYAQQDGAEFHNARRESRNILMGFALDSRFGGGTTRQLREQLYNFFMPKSKVGLTLNLEDDFSVRIDGVVESIQTPMFTEKPVAVVSIVCHDPDFYDPDPILKTGEAYQTLAEYEVEYDGSVPSGINLVLTVNGGVTSNGFYIHHRKPNGDVDVLGFAAQLQGLDEVRINTVPGEKSAMLIRANVESSIMSAIDPQSTWPRLVRGTNYIAVAGTGDQFYYEYTYLRRFGGL